MGCGSSKSTEVTASESLPNSKEEKNNIENITDDSNTKSLKNTQVGKSESSHKIKGENNNTESSTDEGNTKSKKVVKIVSSGIATIRHSNLENDNISGSSNANGSKLVLYSESCKAFPKPPPPAVVTKTDLYEFFSPEVKAIYPGFEAVLRLDEHVKKTPQPLKHDITRLVNYLMEVTSSEYDKARVVIRWVATNIKYNVGFLTTGTHEGSSDAQDVLNDGSAVCEGFSNLVLDMCQLCNLPCEKIIGIAKGSGYIIGEDLVNSTSSKKFRHAWNRIKLNNTWFLCDATWASGYPKIVDGQYRYIFDWDEGYFLVSPDALRYSHKPDDSDFAMVDDIITDVDEWTKQARVYPSGCLYKVFSIKPAVTEGCIETDSNRVELAFRSDQSMNMRYTLIDLSNDKSIKKSIACIKDGDTWKLLVRLPRAGCYSVVLFGEPVSLSDRSKKVSRDMLMSFKIHSTCVTGSEPFPEFTHFLGPTPYFGECGFKSSVTYPIIETLDGIAKFTIQRPGCEPIRFNFRDEHEIDRNEYVFADAYPGKVVFNIRCPKKEEYSLIIFTRTNEGEFKTGATYIILNNNGQETPLLPYPLKVEWGPNEKLAQFDILLNPNIGSEITCNKEETVFEVSFNEKQVNVLYSLKSNNITKNEWLYAETSRHGNDVSLRVRFRIPVIGFHEFNLFAGKLGAKTNDFIGCWLVNVLEPYEGELFGFNKSIQWGANSAKLLANQLLVLSPTSSSITNDKDSVLTIASTEPRRAGVVFSLKDSSGADLTKYVLGDSIQQNDETVLYKFKFYPPKGGFHCFDLFGSSGDHIGSWMVEVEKPEQLELPNNNKQPWGPVQRFYDFGFSVVEPDSAIISTSSETTLVITSGHRGKILGQLNLLNEKEDYKDHFDISYPTENNNLQKIVITFKLKIKGYYKFSLFITKTGNENRYDYAGCWLIHCV